MDEKVLHVKTRAALLVVVVGDGVLGMGFGGEFGEPHWTCVTLCE